MQELLRKIRQILKDRRVRRFFTRVVSSLAAIVVFVTTYALILPAITLEKTAICGIEEHQHSDSCYEVRLVCGQEESDGHHHEDSCCSITTKLVCEVPEHRHSMKNECYDADGNLVCRLEEHAHDDSCYEEVRTLSCGQEEQEGHHHTDACYEKVLVCGKEVHTHNTNCYEKDGLTDDAADGYSADKYSNPADSGDTGNTENSADTGETGKTGNITDAVNTVNTSDTMPGVSDPEAVAEETQPGRYVPELDPLDMEAVLNSHTDFYYFHAEQGEEIPADSAEITDWRKVDKETKLASADLVKMYLAYSIPAGSLNETNPSARYRLPDNLRLSDEQIEAMNRYENGIAAGYRDSGSSLEKDEKNKAKENYKKYLGAEAVEGDRRPDEQPEEGAQEFISAVVRAENVYDDKGHYLGQDLIFTFVPYSIEKNQDNYDADMSLISAGEEITGWFACDFRLDQIDWEQEEEIEEDNTEKGSVPEDNIEEYATVIFAREDQNKNIPEISRVLKMTGEVEEIGENSENGETEDTEAAKATGENSKAGETEGRESAGTKRDSQMSTHVITADGKDYLITVTYESEAEIPQGAELAVRELLPETEEYNQHLQAVEDKIHSGKQEDDTVALTARFFDITILSDGVEVQPSAPVDVRIELTEKVGEDLQVFHFDDKSDDVEELQTEEQAPDIKDSTVQFSTESFSVFAIVGTTIERTVLASDGHNYKVTVTYGSETGIPENADLTVEEILESSSVYDTYVAGTENVLGMEEGITGYIRLFDIKIVDKDDHSVKFQPVKGTMVDVRIELADSESKGLSVVHFADDSENGEKIESRTETVNHGQTVSFAADGFSVYAIVDGDQSTGETYSIKYTFVLEDGTPFYFTNKNGDSTNIQYVKDGEIPINPGTPTMSTGEQEDKEFVGWWTKNGNAWGTELSFDTPVSTSSLQEITVYARYDNTQYITYYDENDTVYLVDRRHENDTVLTTDVKNPVTGEKWTEQELEDYKYVAYQPLSKTMAFLGWTQTKGKTTPDANFTITEATTLYPVIAEVKWVTYHSGPTGSNATYFGAEYALDGNWDRNNLADHIPTRAGYQFDGWYIRNTATQGDNDNLDYSWPVSSEDVRVTDANGNFINSFKNNSTYFENGKLKNDIELVAHWTPTTVNYVYVYYQQKPNANDDGTYDYVYKDSQTASGVAGTNTGTPPVPAWDDIAGFSLHNTSNSDDPYNVKTEVIEGDGSTVVKVYYDRNEYSITFMEPVYTTANRGLYWKNGDNYESLYFRTGNGWTGYTYYSMVDYPDYANQTAYVKSGNNYVQYNLRTHGSRYNVSRWNTITELTITAKYGTDVSQLWPDKRSDLSTDYPQQWYTSTDGNVMQSGIQLMPPNNQVFYNRTNSGVENHMVYWLQDLPSSPEGTAPNTFTSVRNDTIYGNSLSTTWDDYSIYEGFKINIRTQDVSTLNSNNGADVATTNNNYSMSAQIGSSFSSGTNRTLNVYYLRNKYSITFQQDNTIVGSDEYYYEADISNADKYSSAVNVPAGMRFVGWYDNPEGIGDKYSFDGKTMPPNNLILYAKLVPEEYYIRLDYNGGETKGSESTFAWVEYGDTVEEAEDVKRNYVAVAEGETGTHNYIYWRYDEAADASGDGWWSYYLDADGNVVYNNPKDYSRRTAAYVEADGGKYKYDPGKYTFVGWYETDEAGNQISNVPFNFATRITKDTYLKAIFRKEGTFQVRYLPNMGTEGTEGYVAGDPDTAPPTDSYTYIDLSEAKVGHSIEPADSKYQFAGWRVKGTTSPIYQPGETFPINSDYAEEENGIQYITLEPVFIQKGDTSITYQVNTPAGGTAAGMSLTGLTNNAQDKLILDGSVTLHDGDGFAVTGYNLIGWSDKPLQPSTNPVHLKEDGTFEGTIPSDTHIFKLGGKYGVSDEEGNTLYAVWELLTIPVPFTKQGENNLGEYEQLAGAQFKLFTDADCQNLISDVYNEINENEAVVVSSDEEGSNVVFPKVPVGTYYFKETAVGDQYKLNSTVHIIEVVESDDENHTLSYVIDGDHTASNPLVIKNNLKGTLVIKKTVESSDTTGTFNFTAALSDTTISGKFGDLTFTNGIAAFTLEHDGEIKIRNLVGKQITITENNASAYTTTAVSESGSGTYNEAAKAFTITIPDDGDTVAFTNTLETRKLRIKKIGDDAPSGLVGATFSLTSSDDSFSKVMTSLDGTADPDNLGYLPSGDETDGTLFTLPIGNYTLTETNPPEYYDAISGTVDLSVTGEGISITKVGTDEEAPFEGVEIGDPDGDGTYTLTVTNTRRKATVTIIKNVVGTDADKDAEYSFSAKGLTETEDTFSLHGRQLPDIVEEGDVLTQENKKVYTEIPYGTVFSVTENSSSTSPDFDTTIAISNEESPVTTARLTTGDVTVDGDVTITYTNTRNNQPIKVFKFETGTTPEKPLANAVFSLTGPEGTGISYTGLTTNADGYLVNGEGVIFKLPVNNGAYTLTETQAPAGYLIIGDGKTTFTVNAASVAGAVAEMQTNGEAEVATGAYVIKVQNSAGAVLPSTGGSGTTLIYLLGIMLTSLAGAGLVMRKRRRAA